ncbi:MAG: hypothetical protein ACOX33_05285 [Dethiobacteria bacterium]
MIGKTGKTAAAKPLFPQAKGVFLCIRSAVLAEMQRRGLVRSIITWKGRAAEMAVLCNEARLHFTK